MGHLLWTERDYYESSPESVYYAFQGYFDKMKMEESWFRNIAFISYRAAGGKEKNIQKFWTIGDDSKSKEPVRKVFGTTPEEIKATIAMIKERHKIK